jgi:hypothetical protein
MSPRNSTLLDSCCTWSTVGQSWVGCEHVFSYPCVAAHDIDSLTILEQHNARDAKETTKNAGKCPNYKDADSWCTILVSLDISDRRKEKWATVSDRAIGAQSAWVNWVMRTYLTVGISLTLSLQMSRYLPFALLISHIIRLHLLSPAITASSFPDEGDNFDMFGVPIQLNVAPAKSFCSLVIIFSLKGSFQNNHSAAAKISDWSVHLLAPQWRPCRLYSLHRWCPRAFEPLGAYQPVIKTSLETNSNHF